MSLTVTVPESVFERSGGEIARDLLEAATLEAFRARTISLGRLAEILCMTIDEAHLFLKTNKLHSEITAAEIQAGRETLDSILGSSGVR